MRTQRWALRAGVWIGAMAVAMQAVAREAAPRDVRFVTESFPPYTHAAAGRAVGPMVDVVQEACARLAWRCAIEVLPWRRALSMAQRAEVDAIFPIIDSPERRQYFHVSRPVVEGRYEFFVRAGNPLRYTGDARVLEGRVIGAYGPSSTALTLEALIEGVPGARSEIEPDNRTVLRKLSAGRYGEGGVALANEAVAQLLIREHGLTQLQAAGTVKSFGYSFALSRQRLDLPTALAFAGALHELCRSGRTAELFKPYGLAPSPCVR